MVPIANDQANLTLKMRKRSEVENLTGYEIYSQNLAILIPVNCYNRRLGAFFQKNRADVLLFFFTLFLEDIDGQSALGCSDS